MNLQDIPWGTYHFINDLDNQRVRMRFPISINSQEEVAIESIKRGKKVMLVDLDGQQVTFKFPINLAQDQDLPDVEEQRPAPVSAVPDLRIESQARLAGPGTGIDVED